MCRYGLSIQVSFCVLYLIIGVLINAVIAVCSLPLNFTIRGFRNSMIGHFACSGIAST